MPSERKKPTIVCFRSEPYLEPLWKETHRHCGGDLHFLRGRNSTGCRADRRLGDGRRHQEWNRRHRCRVRRRVPMRDLPRVRRRSVPRPVESNPGRRGRNAQHHALPAATEQPAGLPDPGHQTTGRPDCEDTGSSAMKPDGVVIVGAGQAGFQVAASLRMEGYEEPIALIGDEPSLPYQRPPLSKGFMSGKQDIEGVALRPLAFYESHRIELVSGAKVIAIDRVSRSVSLASGRSFRYDRLVLAVGARNRT